MSDDKPHGTPRDANESQRQLLADLELLKLRTKAGKKQNRRGHDMRRTFGTLVRTDGAIDGLLRWVTHGPTNDMMDVYSSPPWSALCTEVGKLKLELREGVLVPMTNSGASRCVKPTRSIARAPGGHRHGAPSGVEPQLGAMVGGMKATPTGKYAIGIAAMPFELLALRREA